MDKPKWWDDDTIPDWIKSKLKRDFVSRITLKDELKLRGYLQKYKTTVVVENINNKPLTSAYACHVPAWLYPHRVYIKLTLLRRLQEQGQFTAIGVSSDGKRTLTYYAIN